jgi:hypothetical protein
VVATDKWVPAPFHIFKDFNHPNFEIRIGDLPDVQNSPKFAGRQFETYGTRLIFGPTSNSLNIASYKLWNKFEFQSSLNFEGVHTFEEKSDKFSKIPSSRDILEYEFIWSHLYSNIRSSFTSEKRDLVYFIPKRADHFSILLPLSHVHHGTKLDKECSKPN